MLARSTTLPPIEAPGGAPPPRPASGIEAADPSPTGHFRGASLGHRLRAGATTAAVLAGVWWGVNPGDLASWVVGGPSVALGAGLAALLPRPAPSRLSLSGTVRFAGFFLWQSVLGAVDVARRALDPRLPIDPAFRRLEIDLPPGPPMTLFANTVTLLPGTLTAEIDGNRLTVHVLDQAGDLEGEFDRLARRVRNLFGLPEPGESR